jgi:hypothetical protein
MRLGPSWRRSRKRPDLFRCLPQGRSSKAAPHARHRLGTATGLCENWPEGLPKRDMQARPTFRRDQPEPISAELRSLTEQTTFTRPDERWTCSQEIGDDGEQFEGIAARCPCRPQPVSRRLRNPRRERCLRSR